MKQFASAGCLAALFLLVPGTSRSQAAQSDSESPFRISVNLNLVVLQVTVHDKKGGFASDLREQDFAVYEDGVKQSVRLFRHEDIPVTVGLVIDHSGSMHRKMPDVLTAARTFVSSSNPQDQMFVINFNERVMVGLPPSIPFTNRADEMESAILRAPAAGETALYDAVDQALDRLQSGGREKKVLIVISDGGDNASVIGLPRILEKAGESNAVLYTIGIFAEDDPDRNPGVLRKLAKETGGEAYFPAEFNEVAGICEAIAKEIRNQYTIGYVSGNTRAGGRRMIRVTAHAAGKDLVTRTRESYIANSETSSEETVAGERAGK